MLSLDLVLAHRTFRSSQTLEGLAQAWSRVLDDVYPIERESKYFTPEVIYEMEKLYRELWRMLGGEKFLY